MKLGNSAILFTVLSGCVCYAVSASEERGYVTDSGIRVTPLFESSLEHNDNIGRFSSNQSSESSGILVLEPGIALESDRGGNEHLVAYQISSGTYFDSSDDNFLDHRFVTNNFIRLNAKHGVSFNYNLLFLHEERGTGLSAGDTLATIVTDPVEYVINDVNSTYVYGSEGAQGRLELSLGYLDRSYKNYREISDPNLSQLSTKYKDFDEVSGGGAFYYRAMPATQALFEIELVQRSYDLLDPSTNRSQDSLDHFYMVGSKWDISGKTTGKLRLGLQNKDYEDSQKDQFTGFSWDVDLQWNPLEHSEVTLLGGQRARDPDQGSNYVKDLFLSSGWKHYWRSNIYSDVELTLRNSDYSSSNRDDDFYSNRLALGYTFNDITDLVLGWEYERVNSTINENSYKQNIWFMSVNLVL
ncbi:outer membrane beta-barrel protein [Vibrio tubiashii]|uniref:outer membrane beta-barrel protein n=1 Tax=Vibrio tubiashii TaxID=29498 RepID=UPI001EFE6FBD|nr:outer membrane beta-barrel protein [Vibrio tubiashii]MCG9580610.1 outer membrane beta-barrel protein [Vibrio tubiashii]MCG9614201.1 outer membrane beta-barrel protein [Vibrio tubiashii]MCG9689334.1 outer membrane beta-barrel protein [Vibrio tubiashii]